MRRGAESKLTLISAPAGFGKTTLLAEWLATVADGEASIAWVSLDSADNEAGTFWTYLIGALRTVLPTVGEASLPALSASPPRPLEVVLATLLNELIAGQGDIILVLDDYHVIEAREIHDGMARLLERLPRRVHLVIATRADPPLPLARLRARGELVEIRSIDLRFTVEEAAAYLSDVMGLTVSTDDVAALEARTEGWIAALQLAALSIQGRNDVQRFIADFTGNDRYIVDYLVEEVLQRQPAAVRTFLLETSILERLTGPLCDAVTARPGGRATLEALDRGNLFIVPLDDRRQWYRYHRLFSDVLGIHLIDEQGRQVRDLHLRASSWFEANGDRAGAIRHALAAEAFDRAADLVELSIATMSRGRQEATLKRWIDALPDDLFETRPVLAIGYVATRLVRGDLEGVEARLTQAERWLTSPSAVERPTDPGTGMIVVDEATFRRLPGIVAMYRTALARAHGDVDATISHAEHLLEVTGPDDHLERGAAAGFLGLAHWSRGDLDVAHGWWIEEAACLQRAGHTSDVVGASIALADIRIAQGRLKAAMRDYERGLEIAAAAGTPALRGVADMHVGMSELFFEWGDLATARDHLATSERLGPDAALAQNPYRWHVVLARVLQAEGDLDGALRSLDQAERLFTSDYFPDVRPIASLKALIWLAQGRTGDAIRWAREQGLSTDDDVSYVREFEHLTLAKVLLADRTPEADAEARRGAMTLLPRLLQAAEDGGRTGGVIRILVTAALAHQADGDTTEALVHIQRALALAEPEGYVQVFVVEGRAMATLLGVAAGHGISHSYVRRLLAAFGRPERRMTPAMVGPLSERESDVLRLLGSELGGPDIARELYVSLNTVRTHTRHIYAKLGVNDRRAAVRRARELGLLS